MWIALGGPFNDRLARFMFSFDGIRSASEENSQKLYDYLIFPCFNVSKVHPQGSFGILKVTLKSLSPLNSE